MLNKTEQSDCAPNANEKQGPCYTRWLAGSPRLAEPPARAIEHLGPLAVTLAETA
jgi:hypothetical protein